jgi:thioredoxin 1
LTEKNFFERLKENPRPVVVDFWAPWCGPCRMIEPTLKQVGKEYEGQVDVWKVNADEHPDLLRSLRIYGIPTIVSFKDGQEVARQTGVASPRSLGNLFDAALSGEQPATLGLTIIDRILRIAIGLALFFLAYTGDFSGIYLFLALLGGVAMFSAFYDRCPLWKAITSRLRGAGSKDSSEDESTA